MANIFRSRDTGLQDEALNEYANGLRKGLAERGERQEAINEYNDKLTGITSTVGSVIGIKPAEKVISSGLKRALGYGTKQVEKKITAKLADLANGDSAFMDKLPSNVSRGLKAVLQDNPNNEIVSQFKNLPKSARDTINRARDRLGKREINENQETTEPRGADTSDTAGGAGEEGAAAADEGDLTGAAAGNLTEAQGSAADFIPRMQNLSEEGRAAVFKEFTEHPNYTPSSANPTDAQLEENGRIAQNSLAKQEQLEGTQPADQPIPDEASPTDAAASEGTSSASAGQGTPDGASATEQQSGASADSDGAIQANADATDLSTAASTATETGEGLGGVADALDVAAAAEGGGNIFVDIAAGIASLATIIGGEAARKSPAKATISPISSQIQYGV
jgi:hypothetical protein